MSRPTKASSFIPAPWVLHRSRGKSLLPDGFRRLPIPRLMDLLTELLADPFECGLLTVEIPVITGTSGASARIPVLSRLSGFWRPCLLGPACQSLCWMLLGLLLGLAALLLDSCWMLVGLFSGSLVGIRAKPEMRPVVLRSIFVSRTGPLWLRRSFEAGALSGTCACPAAQILRN